MIWSHYAQICQVVDLYWAVGWVVGYNIMSQFKETWFARLHRDLHIRDKQKPPQSNRHYVELIAALSQLAEWSLHLPSHTTTTTLLNYDHKSIYSNGIIVTQDHHTPPTYTLEVVTSVPFDPPSDSPEPQPSECRRIMAHLCERTEFKTNPIEMFQTAGYEPLDQYSLVEVERFVSYSQGIECNVYPRLEYLEIIERHPGMGKKFEQPEHSFSKFLLRKIKGFLSENQEMSLNSNTQKPKDFFQTNKSK